MRTRNVPLPEAHLVALAAGAVVHRAHPRWLPLPAAVRLATGAAAVAAALALGARAVAAAGPVHLAAPAGLVTSGPYRTRRHPMYVAWALLHLGIGLLRGSAWVAVTLPAAAAWVHRAAVREELELEARFPDDYRRYRASVPRYLAVRRGRRLVQC